MNHRHSAAALVLLGVARLAWADGCRLEIAANDMMQFDQHELSVPSDCTEVELTLKHVGSEPANAMGHDWVLAKTRDMAALVSAGAAAGLAHDFQPTGDPRILASTKIVGGGEKTIVKFSTAGLQPYGDYSFFCSSPGHFNVMKGKFIFGGSSQRVAQQHLQP